MIALQSTRDLLFPSAYRGIVTMTIDLIQINDTDRIYTFRITDVCHVIEQEEYQVLLMEDKEVLIDENDEEKGTRIIQVPQLNEDGTEKYETKTRDVKKYVGEAIVRNSQPITYEQLDAISEELDLDVNSKYGVIKSFSESVRQGFLAKTIQEINEGKGRYFSDEITDWKILRD